MDSFDYSDIEPLPLDDSRAQLGQIMYSSEYKSTVGILRGLMARKEYSDRALAVTDRAISLSPAHYTLWQFRLNIIKALIDKQPDQKAEILDKELEQNETVAINNPKNYQIWNYRELLIKAHPAPNPKRELPLIEAIIIEDNKNYHTWSYRTWLVKQFGLYNEESEINFVNILLDKDVRNNSAWSFRYFLKFSPGKSNKLTPEYLNSEIKYAKRAIESAPQNPSSWNYLLGIFDYSRVAYSELEEFCLQYVDFEDIRLDTLLTSDLLPVRSLQALETLAKIYNETKKEKSQFAYKVLEIVDPVRVNYWQYQMTLVR